MFSIYYRLQSWQHKRQSGVKIVNLDVEISISKQEMKFQSDEEMPKFQKSFIQYYQTMTQAIREYFQRFRSDITESIYSNITVTDYHRNKAYNQYLDFDRETIFRKNKATCGIRNIDNSCYLSVTLQLLYNIQSFREKIFSLAELENPFLIELRKLFAMMYKGSLCYVDPTNIYLTLKQAYPTIFVDGFQNDFHEVLTVVLQHIEKTIPREEDKKFCRKIFYGRTKVNIYDASNKNPLLTTQNHFNIISLPSATGSFDQAIADYREEIVEGYTNEKNQKITAIKESQFIETPGLLAFLINRVIYKDKKLVKDSGQFHYDDTILFSKTSLKKKGSSTCKDLEEESKKLIEWIEQIGMSKKILIQTLQYLQKKQFENLSGPSIINEKGEKHREITKNYIDSEIKQIDNKIAKAKVDLENIEMKKVKIAEDSYSELYSIWALMIHSGKSAEFGHYKMCINVKDNTWIEFNDRRADQISPDKIKQYKKKGEVCCIFYKRNNLICHSEFSQVPASLKKLVQEEEAKLIKKIDTARVTQALYQQTESAHMIWQFESMAVRKSKTSYFFNPLRHLLEINAPEISCKGFVLYRIIKESKFLQNLKEKLIDPSNLELCVPSMNFAIPHEYNALSLALKQFLDQQYLHSNIVQAFSNISFFMDIEIKSNITLKYFTQLRELLVIRGIFFQSLMIELNILETYEAMKSQVDKICNCLPSDSGFALVCVALRGQLSSSYKKRKLVKCEPFGMLKTIKQTKIFNYQETFQKRFGLELSIRSTFVDKHEEVLEKFRTRYQEYAKFNDK